MKHFILSPYGKSKCVRSDDEEPNPQDKNCQTPIESQGRCALLCIKKKDCKAIYYYTA